MPVTKVLRTQSRRVWLRQNMGIVGTPCVGASPSSCFHKPSPSCKGDASVPTLPPSHSRPYETTPLPSSFHETLPLKALRLPLWIRSGFRGDVKQWLTTCKAGDVDRRVRRRFRGNVTQCLPVKARHLRLCWSRWARVTNGPGSLFTATSARLCNGTLTGSSARDHLHLGGGPGRSAAGGRDEHLASSVGVANGRVSHRRAVERHTLDCAASR
jgi:hypothetical protein